MRRPPATASTNENGQPVTGLPVFVCVHRALQGILLGFLFCLAESAHCLDTMALADVSQLARLGAPQLALRRVNAAQPGFEQSPVEWMAWEQERLQIMLSQGMHAQLVTRVNAMPAVVDQRFIRLAFSLKADAQLQSGEAQAARATLRELLWFTNAEAEPGQLESWRRLVVRSYLLEDRSEDAQLALARYRQDFGDENPEWLWLSAAVALRTGHAGSALRLLERDESMQGRLLRLTAQLVMQPDQAVSIESAAVQDAESSDQPGLQRAFWTLAANAARKAGKMAEEIRHLERALSLPTDREFEHAPLSVTPDRLWSAYQELGQTIGNQEQLLLGNDEDWYFPATEAVASDPFRARILFAVLAEHGSDEQRRALAHEYLAGLLDDLPDGRRLVQQLYLHSRRFERVENLPDVIRYRLVDEALAASQLQTASRLMEGLNAPPSDSDHFEWDLRRIRVSIFTGSVDDATRLLYQLLADENRQWDREHVDRLLQVVFDLQAMERHEQALEMFEILAQKHLEAGQMRELLYWMADSRLALEQYEQAAYLYLKSAVFADPLAMDPWAQTARYQAARALVKAGLPGDARRIYIGLLRTTRDAGRKAVLENEIQRLRLVRGGEEAGG